MTHKLLCFITICLLFSINLCFGQAITVTPATSTAEAQVAIQAMAGKGVVIENVTVSGTMNSNQSQFGSFTKNDDDPTFVSQGGSVVLDFDQSNQGIIMSSGRVDEAVGSTGSCGGANASSPMGGGGDPDLTLIAGNNTFDACIVEFDVTPAGDFLEFNYVFASDEYEDYVCSTFNDFFAFLVSGPGINGTQGFTNNAVNIALVRDLVTDEVILQSNGDPLPVAIGSINNGANCANNTCNSNSFGFTCPCNPFLFVPNHPSTAIHNNIIRYDGMTRRLKARIDDLTPCETYHFKLAIADKGDSIFDSAVFIESGSLVSNVANIEAEGDFYAEVPVDPNDPDGPTTNGVVAVEGCINFPYQLNFDLDTDEDATLNLVFGGNAENGIDFEFIDNTISVPANTDSLELEIIPINNNDNELDLLIIYLESISYGNCEFPLNDSLYVYILDNSIFANNINFNVDPINWGTNKDTTTTTVYKCNDGAPFTNIEAYSTNFESVVWEPSSLIIGGTDFKPAFNITEDTWIYATFSTGGCEFVDSFFVQIPPPPTAENDTVCPSGTVTLEIEGILTANWTSPNDPSHISFLSNTSSTSPNFTAPDESLNISQVVYEIWGVDENSCSYNINDTVFIRSVDVFPGIQTDWDKCPNQPLTLTIPGGVNGTYTWTLEDGTSFNNEDEELILTQDGEQTITIQAEDASGCSSTTFINIAMLQDLTDAGADYGQCYNATITIGSPAMSGYTYSWAPTTGLDDPTLAQPTVNIDTLSSGAINELTYTVTMTDVANNCSFSDDVTIIAYSRPNVTANVVGNNPIVLGGSTSLQAAGAGTSNYQWIGDGLLNNQGEIVNVKPTQLGETTYEVTGYDENGCFKSATVTVETTPPPNFLIPNSFSPNNDGFNDVFRPLLSNVENINAFLIYNRWGELLFQGDGVNAAWDGTYKGIAQDIGVYIWYIEYTPNGELNSISQKGNVTLLR